MIRTIFQLPLASPRLAWEALNMIGSMTQDDPIAWLKQIERLGITNADKTAYLAQSSTRPACVVLNDEILGTIILLSGTEGALHVPILVNGWLTPGMSSEGNGANPAFQVAVTDILHNLPEGIIHAQNHEN